MTISNQLIAEINELLKVNNSLANSVIPEHYKGISINPHNIYDTENQNVVSPLSISWEHMDQPFTPGSNQTIRFSYDVMFQVTNELQKLLNQHHITTNDFLHETVKFSLKRNGIELNANEVIVGLVAPSPTGPALSPIEWGNYTQLTFVINNYPHTIPESFEHSDVFEIKMSPSLPQLASPLCTNNLPPIKVFYFNPEHALTDMTSSIPARTDTSHLVYFKQNPMNNIGPVKPGQRVRYFADTTAITDHQTKTLFSNNLDTCVKLIEQHLKDIGYTQTRFERVDTIHDADLTYKYSGKNGSSDGAHNIVKFGTGFFSSPLPTTFHETGHCLGLVHQYKDVKSVMNYEDGRTTYTAFDAYNLKQLYPLNN